MYKADNTIKWLKPP